MIALNALAVVTAVTVTAVTMMMTGKGVILHALTGVDDSQRIMATQPTEARRCDTTHT